jgi:hypothetical protein
MAGFAGTSLLVRQNELIRVQTMIAEATRASAYNAELTAILDELHEEVQWAQENKLEGPAQPRVVIQKPYWFEEKDNESGEALARIVISASLFGRIIAFSKQLEPYQTGLGDSAARVHSPERRNLFLALNSSGIEMSIFGGTLDLSYADFSGQSLYGVDFGGMKLANSRFDHSELSGCSFGAADLTDASFRGADVAWTSAGDFNGTILPPPVHFSGAEIDVETLHRALVDDKTWKAEAAKHGVRFSSIDDNDSEIIEIDPTAASAARPISTRVTAIFPIPMSPFRIRVPGLEAEQEKDSKRQRKKLRRDKASDVPEPPASPSVPAS